MRCKALFLLVIFLLNTLVGFACALQIRYASPENKVNGRAHDHSSHSHEFDATEIKPKHSSHSHQPANHENAHKKLAHTNSESAEGNYCCQDEVIKFHSVDKIVSQFGSVVLKIPVIDIAIFQFTLLAALPVKKGFAKYIDNRQRPPTSDIRVSIQSFQI